MYKYLQQLILIPIILCMFSYNVFVADTKTSDLAELAVTPADTDEMYINDGGTSKKIQYSNVMSGEATTAASLAADPTDCAANQFADVIAANGNLTCSAIVDADVPNDITITLAATATASADNFTSAAGDDFTVKDTDADIYNTGSDLSGTFTDDIAGTTRTTWDIGAFEYVAAASARRIMIIQ